MSIPDGAVLPDGLLDAFWDYERALMANDLEALDRLFAPGADTLRGDAAGLLVGHDAISGFRRGRGGAPQRSIQSVQVRPVSPDAALVVAITVPATGGRGQQTQLWRLLPGAAAGEAVAGGPSADAPVWAVEAAHVSVPAPAIAASIWRVVGTPLVEGSDSRDLAGQTIAVKDLFAVEGYATGGGVPQFLAEATPATAHAGAVAALLATGASVTGIAQTDEFAYSIAGKNPHYGTPPNAAVPGAVPGGSSSGPASAVAAGQVTIGLATDTGGSIRVPASYQGLWGLRTTHGAVSVDGLLPLAPSFDTVGWLTRDAWTLRAAATASLDLGAQLYPAPRFAIAPALAAVASGGVRDAFDSTIASLEASGTLGDLIEVDLGDIDELFETFRTAQGAEAWASHGEWIDAHPGALGEDIAARFAWASTISTEAEALARVKRVELRARIEAALDGRFLLLPSASSVAPSTTASSAEIEVVRGSTLRLTCVAGLLGAPALSAPLMTVEGAPVGLCVVGPRFSDIDVIVTGAKFAAALGYPAS